MNHFEITSAAPRPATISAPWQPSALDSRRLRMVDDRTPDRRLVGTRGFTHYNSNVPMTGAVSVKAGALGAAKQAAPPRGVPR